MSATVFLFATEEVYDTFEKKLNKAFGKGKWNIDGSKYSDDWGHPALTMDLPIVDSTDRKTVLGTIKVTNKREVIEYHDGPGVVTVPKSIKIILPTPLDNSGSTSPDMQADLEAQDGELFGNDKI